MSLDAFHENWDALKGRIRKTYGKLTDDDLICIEGRREQLVTILQDQYHLTKDEADFHSKLWAMRATASLPEHS